MTAIEVRGLTRRYSGGFEAVRNVSFDVERGEMFALLGTNGAGKTSTVEVVEGLSRPAEGTVRVLGHDPFSERRLVRPRVGVMLQEGGFPPDLTVSEATGMWAGTLTSPRPVDEALSLVDLTHRASVRVKQLSGGERRRLDLALALLGKPEVLFLDEPTTGLDPESRRNTWKLIRALLLEGVTVLLTTHYLEEAQALADRLAIMHRGRIVAQGTVSEVVDAYPARISFVPPEGVPLPVVVEAEVSGRVTVRTNNLQESLHELLSWAHANGVVLSGLDARSASLEEAFLAIAEEAA
ncbi:ABC-2 type transport system ATP-binding protein [Lentzea xinjiangensis]|uniref:ABC-2 type transport system ATP-binding protein n=1 Tax=Lentzea xinjiangensis TaxID=402600 RepID=A0A1H9L858_9PSEU|nr:ABC transporter ATP-binding protein [Lentzea xinjiangensis]SER07419.1 ABC-2 type transport system ATP-binding protein [Lentzea xinjiangensis]